jgi:hypothetical protein
VTCDILGREETSHHVYFPSHLLPPAFNAPFAIASIGLTPGVLLYILFGAFAFLSGVMLCKIFCRLDSVRFPIKTFGDLGYVIFGPAMRHFASLLQTVRAFSRVHIHPHLLLKYNAELIINVGIIVCLVSIRVIANLT